MTTDNEPTIKPVHVDGALLGAIAFCGVIVASMGSEDAVKFITGAEIFYFKMVAEAIGATCTAIYAYRSQAYSKHLADKEEAKAIADGNQQVTTATTTQTTKTNEITESPTPSANPPIPLVGSH